MQKAKVVDNALPNGDFKDSSTQAALDGTTVRAAFQNDNFNNLFELVEKSGQSLIDNDTTQISKAVVKQSLASTYKDIGNENEIILTNEGIDEETLFDGMTILFTPANANTAATTLKIKTLDVKPLYFDGAVLAEGFLETDSNYIAVYDIANNRFNCSLLVSSKNLESVVSNILTGYKNILINTELRVNQRGYANTSVTDGTYMYDRFKAVDGSATILNTGQITGAVAQVIEEENIESGNYTFSNANCDVTIDGVTKTTPCTFAITVNADVEVKFSNGNLKNIQMEKGSIATNKELRPVGVELGLSQRYYQKHDSLYPYVIDSALLLRRFYVTRIEEMRAAPTESGSVTNTSDASFFGTKDVIQFSCTATELSAGCFIANYSADAEL